MYQQGVYTRRNVSYFFVQFANKNPNLIFKRIFFTKYNIKCKKKQNICKNKRKIMQNIKE
ncbi:MAG: hypothetical protein BHW47_04890 [Roseburia inulinivorans]|nr:MAG: hypothetical protein BHW47_04890 [Roseburia inulinivorans]